MTQEAEHQPRALKLQGRGQFDELHRIARTDEEAITERARRRDVASELTRLEGELQAQLRNLRDPEIRPTRQTYRDLGNAIVLIGKVRKRLASVGL